MNNDPVILTLSFYMTRCLSRQVVANEKLRERNRGGGAAKIAGVCHGMRYKTFPSRRQKIREFRANVRHGEVFLFTTITLKKQANEPHALRLAMSL